MLYLRLLFDGLCCCCFEDDSNLISDFVKNENDNDNDDDNDNDEAVNSQENKSNTDDRESDDENNDDNDDEKRGVLERQDTIGSSMLTHVGLNCDDDSSSDDDDDDGIENANDNIENQLQKNNVYDSGKDIFSANEATSDNDSSIKLGSETSSIVGNDDKKQNVNVNENENETENGNVDNSVDHTNNEKLSVFNNRLPDYFELKEDDIDSSLVRFNCLLMLFCCGILIDDFFIFFVLFLFFFFAVVTDIGYNYIYHNYVSQQDKQSENKDVSESDDDNDSSDDSNGDSSDDNPSKYGRLRKQATLRSIVLESNDDDSDDDNEDEADSETSSDHGEDEDENKNERDVMRDEEGDSPSPMSSSPISSVSGGESKKKNDNFNQTSDDNINDKFNYNYNHKHNVLFDTSAASTSSTSVLATGCSASRQEKIHGMNGNINSDDDKKGKTAIVSVENFGDHEFESGVVNYKEMDKKLCDETVTDNHDNCENNGIAREMIVKPRNDGGYGFGSNSNIDNQFLNKKKKSNKKGSKLMIMQSNTSLASFNTHMTNDAMTLQPSSSSPRSTTSFSPRNGSPANGDGKM